MASPRPRILSISADRAVFDSRNRVLEFMGFDVVGCFEGTGAMERFKSEVFEAVIIGHSMPARARLQLMCEMKKCKPRIPVVLIQESGDAGEDMLQADAVCDSLDSPEHLIQTLSKLVGFVPRPVRSAAGCRAAMVG